jgi:hypothetical protein
VASTRPTSAASAGRARSRDEGYRPDPDRSMALGVVLAAGFVTLLDVSIVNVALPCIQRGLLAQPNKLQWIVAGHALSLGLLLVPAGRFGDAHGRRPVFMVGVALFVVASVACALAPTELALVVMRIGEAVGTVAAEMRARGSTGSGATPGRSSRRPTRGSAERRRRTEDLDPEPRSDSSHRGAVGLRARTVGRGADLDEEPLVAARSDHAKHAGTLGRDDIGVRHAEWQEDDVAGHGVDAPIVDHEAGRALQHDELLVLATVHVQRRGRPARRVPLPHPGVPLRLLGGQLDRDPATGDPPALGAALAGGKVQGAARLHQHVLSLREHTRACVELLRRGPVKHPTFACTSNRPVPQGVCNSLAARHCRSRCEARPPAGASLPLPPAGDCASELT